MAEAQGCHLLCFFIIATDNGEEIITIRNKLVLSIIAVHPVKLLHLKVFRITLIIKNITSGTL